MAQAFVGAGMNVVIADIRRDHIRRGRGGLRGEPVHAIELDVTDREGFARAADEAERVFGNVHVLCNNAGMGILGPATVARYDDWDWGLGVLLGGVVNGIQTFLPRMLAHGEGGHIVNTSSMAGVLPIPGAADLHHGQGRLDRTLARRCAASSPAEGIGVSAFCPGPVQTNIREGGRTRPERYGDSGYVELERELEERPNSPLWMDPLECGERVLAASGTTTCTSSRTASSARAPTSASGRCSPRFPDEPLNERAGGGDRFLLSNPIFGEVLGRRSA